MPYKDPERERERGRLRYAEEEVNGRRATELARKRELARRMRASDPEKYKRIRRESMRRHKATRLKNEQSRRARKLGQFIETVNPQECYLMHGGMCGICKGFIEGDFHVDHVVPLSKGGMHGYINCQPAHPKCNLQKGNRV